MKEFLNKVRQSLAGRLLVLRKKCSSEQLKKKASMLWMRLQILWLRGKLKLKDEEVRLLAAAEKLRSRLTREQLKGYARTLRELPKALTKENLKKWAASGWKFLRGVPEGLRKHRKGILAASTAAVALWLILGPASSMAWLTYTAPGKRNSFQVGKMDLTVEYRRPDMADYEKVTEDTRIFSDEALYEPGYTQLVYLRMGNRGDIAFDYEITVRDFAAVDSTNVYGDVLHLPDHLRFGLITAASEPELERRAAQAIASEDMEAYCHRLGEYSRRGTQLTAGQTEYAALVVFMPEDVGNEANYRGDVPQVSLGVTINAQQAGTMEK